jgi:hypothetical protein
MTTESETKKPRISKEKEALIKTVEKLGISAEGLSDADLLKKVVEEFSKTNDKLVGKLADAEESSIKKYSSEIEHNIKDQELIIRLMQMGVPNFYLHLFRDEDLVLSDREIWSIVNESGINPYVNVQDLFKVQKHFKAAAKKKRKRG